MGEFLKVIRSGKEASDPAGRRWAAAGLRALTVAFAVVALWGCARDDERVVAELERLSQGRGPGEYFSQFHYVCFSVNHVLAGVDFLETAKKKSIPLTLSNCLRTH